MLERGEGPVELEVGGSELLLSRFTEHFRMHLLLDNLLSDSVSWSGPDSIGEGL